MACPTTETHSDPNAASATFYAVGGSLRNDAPSYVERQADHELFDALNRHEFCYILTSRQMGKSSLMIRTVHRLRQEGTRAIVLDLTAIGSNLTAEQWYLGLLDRLAEQLDLEEECEDYWQAHLDRGPLQRWMGALREVVLARLSAPVVLFIDEIDAVRSLPFSTDEFFAAIRECYNRRAEEEIYHRLTFCLLGVAAPSDLIRDTRLTPFNIGRRIELTDFTLQEAAPLAAGLGPNPPTPFPDAFAALTGKGVGGLGLLARILYWTDGHPYLTQRLCQAVAQHLATNNQPSIALIDSVCSDLFLASRARERDDNLLFVRERLLRSEVDLVTLLDTYGRVVAGKRVADEASNGVVTALRLSGAVKGERGWLRVRNRIYGRVFDRVWVRENLPYAELWRQQRAYRRGLMRALTGSSVVLAVVIGLAWGAFSNAREARAETDKVRRLLYGSKLNQIQSAWENNEAAQVEELLNETQSYRERGFEWYYWQRMLHQDLLTLDTQNGPVITVAFSPDGKQIMTGSPFHEKVWDADGGRELRSVKEQMTDALPETSVAFSPDGKRIVIGSYDNTAKVWDAISGRRLLTLKGHNAYVNCVAFSVDGKRIVTGSDDRTAKVWDAFSGRSLLTLNGHSKQILAVAFSIDGKRIVTGSYDNTAKTWDAVSGRELLTLKGHEASVNCVVFSPDGHRIVTGSDDRTAKVWDAVSGRELLALSGHTLKVISVAFSPDGKRIATGSEDTTARVWDAGNGRELLRFKGHTTGVHSVMFSPDNKRLLTGSNDRTVKVWDATSNREPVTLDNKACVYSAAFSGDGNRIVIGGEDGIPSIWDADTGRVLTTLKGHTSSVTSVACSPDGTRIATGSDDSTAKVWDAVSGRELLTLSGHTGRVTSVAFSSDGKRIVTGSDDRTAKVWDAVSGRELRTLKGYKWSVTSVAFSPDGNRIVTGSNNAGEDVKVWDAVSGRQLLTLKKHDATVPVEFSPDSNRIVTGSADGAKVWDASDGRELVTLKVHNGGVSSVTFSPDGKRILTGLTDNTARVWDALSGSELLTLRGHTEVIGAVAFSPDGNRIVTGSEDRTTKVWEAATPQQVAAWKKDCSCSTTKE